MAEYKSRVVFDVVYHFDVIVLTDHSQTVPFLRDYFDSHNSYLKNPLEPFKITFHITLRS